MPSLSILVCTRDRGVLVGATVRSILDCADPDLELLVVDQSSDSATADLLAGISDSRLRYLRTDTRGLSAARNVGLRLARGSIVAMTDDDCTVAPTYVRETLRAFALAPRIGLVFGNVVPAPHEASLGFIPAYERSSPFLAQSLGDKAAVEGMGACMACRRQAVLELGGFDEGLGAGSALAAGEDVDLTLRILAAGMAVYETPRIEVTHHRFHRWEDGRRLVRAYWLGAGAAVGKHARRHPMHGLTLLGQLGLRFLVGRSRVAQSLGPARMPVARLMAFGRGFALGVRPAALGVQAPDASDPRAEDAATGS